MNSIMLAKEFENKLWVLADYVHQAVYEAHMRGVLEEREACIKLLEDFSQTTMVPVKDTWRMGLIAGANALRARELGDLTKEAEQNGEEL